MTSGKEGAEGKGRSRRGALILLSGVAAALALPGYLRRRAVPDATVAIDGLPGFSRVETGEVTGGLADPFIGLGEPGPPPASRAQVCAALYPPPPGGQVPVAFFTDVQCPLCRRMEPGLVRRADAGEIALRFHDLTGLGPVSELAARALAAAALQDGEARFRARLARSVLPTGRQDVAEIAEGAGLDSDRLLRDLEGPAVAARLDIAARLAARLGFYATPGTVVGRVAVLGYLAPGDLDRLIGQAVPGRAACD